METEETERPVLDLVPLEGTVVHTSTQESYDELMRIYESGGWMWKSQNLPTRNRNNWKDFRMETCVDAGIEYNDVGILEKGIFGCGRRKSHMDVGSEIISTQEFYNRQRLTSSMIGRINEWFSRDQF